MTGSKWGCCHTLCRTSPLSRRSFPEWASSRPSAHAWRNDEVLRGEMAAGSVSQMPMNARRVSERKRHHGTIQEPFGRPSPTARCLRRTHIVPTLVRMSARPKMEKSAASECQGAASEFGSGIWCEPSLQISTGRRAIAPLVLTPLSISATGLGALIQTPQYVVF